MIYSGPKYGENWFYEDVNPGLSDHYLPKKTTY